MNKLFAICNKLRLLNTVFEENRFVKCKDLRYKWDIFIPGSKILLMIYTPNIGKDSLFKGYLCRLSDLGYTTLVIPRRMVVRHAMNIEMFLEISKVSPGVHWYTSNPEMFQASMEEIKQVLQQAMKNSEFLDTYNQDLLQQDL